MEFPALGEQCEFPQCNQIDFLPLQCKCIKVFCRDHFNDHCLSGECELSPKPKEVNFKNESHIFRCSEKGCRKGNFHEMLCRKCKKHFCIDHRFHPTCPEIDDETMAAKIEELEAPRRQFQEANKHLQEKITENIRKALQSTSKVKTASKIHLMRIKQKAIGPKTIPVTDRVYFSIKKPVEETAKSFSIVQNEDHIVKLETVTLDPDLKDTVPIFVDKKWSLGRCIDCMCECCNVKNENNKMGNVKLRVFRQLDGYCVSPLKMDFEIKELMEQEVLLEGDKLVLEYVDNNVLNDLDESCHLFLS